jgi:hypothetical protein
MKKQINEIKRMQQLAGILKESQLNENETADELFQMFKDEDLLNDRREYDVEDLMSAYPGLSKEEAEKLENMLQGLKEITEENGVMPEEEILNILNQNGVDEDYFESMGGKEIESGTEEWMGILTDVIEKDAYEADLTDEDNQKIMSFIKKLKEMGIELV